MAFSRRELLVRFGLVAGSLPLLDAFGNAAWAGPAAPAKRLICITIPHGIFTHHWLPFVPNTRPVSTNSPGSFFPAPDTFFKKVPFQQRAECTVIDMLAMSGALSPTLSPKWQALKSKTAFISNLGGTNTEIQGHTSTAMLGGYKNPDPGGLPLGYVAFTGETIDVVVANKLVGRTPLVMRCPDVRWDAAGPEDPLSHSVRKGADGTFDYVPALRDPQKTWDLLFSSYVPPDPGSIERSPTARKLALLERTLANLTRLKRDSRLSAYDAQRIDKHANLIAAQRDNVVKLSHSEVSALAPPVRPGPLTSDEAGFFAVKTAMFTAQWKNAAAAVMMNKSPVVSINTGLESGWVDRDFNIDPYHGNAGHFAYPSAEAMEQVRKVQQFTFDAIADFLITLDVAEDPASGATYLDNSLVLITPEHDGRPNGHLRCAVPSIVAGGFGTFTPGKLYDFSLPAEWATPDTQKFDTGICRGLSHGRLLRTIANAFNVTAAELSAMDLQANDNWWNGASAIDAGKPLTGLVTPS